jgi:hypothetical protein
MDACFATSAFWQARNWEWFERYRDRQRRNPKFRLERVLTPVLLVAFVGVGIVADWFLWSDSSRVQVFGVGLLVVQAMAMAVWSGWVIIWVRHRQREEGA